ncbi:MAG: hypothetical protein RBG13Loki_3826 [Promethearchaeota archaeon CR_4]|nr:MAG: hypothetical protein RBG13Loki_3826 [Candidatus Lokiarchaeota archaeon CR_4]
MSENTVSYIPEPEWDPVKKKAPTVEYVNSYLHYRGFKCLTDGIVYYLDPSVDKTKLSLPILGDIKGDILMRQIHVSISRTQEVDIGTKRSPVLVESILRKTERQYQYWEFFLGEKNDFFFPSPQIFSEEQYIEIDWCEPPEREEEEKEAKPWVEFTAFNAQSSKEKVIAAVMARDVETSHVRHPQTSSIKVKMPGEVWEYFKIAPEYESVFDSLNHTFLIMGDKAYLCTNLIQLLSLPRNFFKTSNSELVFQMPY